MKNYLLFCIIFLFIFTISRTIEPMSLICDKIDKNTNKLKCNIIKSRNEIISSHLQNNKAYNSFKSYKKKHKSFEHDLNQYDLDPMETNTT